MRVLSLIPAFLFAAASFVAAAPTSTPADTSCAPHSMGGNGNDAPLQPVISIIANATTYLQPLSVELAGLKGDSCTPDAVSAVTVKITAVVTTCVSQLQAAATVDLNGLDLTHLCSTIYEHLNLLCVTLNALVTVVISLGANAVVTIRDVICNLLNAVLGLVVCLQVFVNASLTGVLGPLLELACGTVKLILSIVIGVNVAPQ